MEVQKRSIDWATMLVPFAIVIALMAVFMIFPEDSKTVVDTMRGFFGDTIGLYYPIVAIGSVACALYENFIKAMDGTIYLIDWEYSGMNDPMADFAALFLEAGFEKENEDYILDKYFEGNIPADAREKILCYQILWDYLWAQWTVIKEAKGDDFGTYGLDRFNRAIENLKKITK